MKQKKRERGILFDLDGVILDSEKASVEIFQKVLSKFGIKISFKEASKYYLGKRDIDAYSNFVFEKKMNCSPQFLSKEHNKIYNNKLPKFKEFLGVERILLLAKELSYKIAVVSGSSRKQIDSVMKRLGYKKFFDAVVSSEDVLIGKPSPEGYLKASERIKVLIENCIVLEDSETGILAGNNAGAYTIGVEIGNFSKQDLSKANLIVRNLNEISEEFLKEFPLTKQKP